jgi:hypothetical protein
MNVMRKNGKRMYRSYIPNRDDALLYLDAAIAQERAHAARYHANAHLTHDPRHRAHLLTLATVASEAVTRLSALRIELSCGNIVLVRP